MRQEERIRRINWQQKINAEKRSAQESSIDSDAISSNKSSPEINRKFASNNDVDSIIVEVHEVGKITPLSGEEVTQIEKPQEENSPPVVEPEISSNSGRFKKKQIK